MRKFAIRLALLASLFVALGLPALSAVPVIQSKVEEKEGSPSSSMTIDPVPSGIVSGDVLIIAISIGTARTIATPTGFTIIDVGETDGSGNSSGGVFYKIATGSEPSSYTVSWTGGNAKGVIEMYRIDGAVSGDEIQDPGEVNLGTSITPTITPVASTDTDDSLVMVVHFVDDRDVDVDAGGDSDYNTTPEDADNSGTSGGSHAGIGVQIKSIATAAVPPQCDLTILASEQWRTPWFAVRSTAPPAGEARRRVGLVMVD